MRTMVSKAESEWSAKSNPPNPKIVVLGGFDSLSREQYQCNYQKALMVAKSCCSSH